MPRPPRQFAQGNEQRWCAGYVLHTNQLRAQHELTDQLQTALESRDVIGQAKGLLMARHGIDADGAFGMLRSTSQNGNIELREVAAKVIELENVDPSNWNAHACRECGTGSAPPIGRWV